MNTILTLGKMRDQRAPSFSYSALLLMSGYCRIFIFLHCELDWKLTCCSGCYLPKPTILVCSFTSQLKYLKTTGPLSAGWLPAKSAGRCQNTAKRGKTLSRWLLMVLSPDCDTLRAHSTHPAVSGHCCLNRSHIRQFNAS